MKMKDLDTVLRDIEYYVSQGLQAQQRLNEIRLANLSPGVQDTERSKAQRDIDEYKERVRNELQLLVDFPPRHLRHVDKLDDFWHDGSYEQSVFVMTKFPDTHPNPKPKTVELNRVIDAVKKAVQDSGYIPRVALFPSNYHPALWDNVELHLLGCRQGIAIVEDRYVRELNPNVAMEWGWMRGMGKRVLFLVEQGFKHFRADLGGLLNESFKWDDPEPGVNAAVTGWLGAAGAGGAPG